MNEVELETLVANIEGNASSYEGMLHQVQDSVDKTVHHVEEAHGKIEKFSEATKGFFEKAIAAAEVFGAGHWFHQAFEMYEKFEEQHIRMHAILEANGRDVRHLTAEYERYSRALQETSSLSKEQIMHLFQVAEGYKTTGEKANQAVTQAMALAAYTGQSAEAMLRLSTAAAKGDTKGAMRMARMVKELRGVKSAAEFAERYNHLVAAGLKVSGELAETVGGKIKKLSNTWHELLAILGGVVSDVITPVVDGLKSVVEWFRGLDQVTQVILLSLPALIGLLAGLPLIFGMLEAVLAPVFAILLNPVFLIIAAAAAVLIYQLGGLAATWKIVKDAALQAWDWIRKKIDEFMVWVYPIWQAVESLFTTGWRLAKEAASEAWDAVVKLWGQFTDWIAEIWAEVSDNTDVTWTEIQEGIRDAFIAAEFVITHFSEVVDFAWTLARLGAESMRADFEYFFTAAIPAYIDWFGDHWKEIIQGVATFQFEVLQNMVENIVNVFSHLDDLVAGKMTFGQIWKPLQTSLEKTLKTLPEIAKRPLSELEKELIAKGVGQGTALWNEWEKFKDDKLKEFAAGEWEVDVGKEAEKAGDAVATGLGGGADKAMHKVDAALASSQEALSRILDYRDKLDRKNNESDAQGSVKPIKVEAVNAKGQEANARQVENRDLLKSIRDGINKIAEKPPVILEDADF